MKSFKRTFAKITQSFTIMEEAPIRAPASQFHIYLLRVNSLAQHSVLNSVLNVKALVGAFNKEKALVIV